MPLDLCQRTMAGFQLVGMVTIGRESDVSRVEEAGPALRVAGAGDDVPVPEEAPEEAPEVAPGSVPAQVAPGSVPAQMAPPHDGTAPLSSDSSHSEDSTAKADGILPRSIADAEEDSRERAEKDAERAAKAAEMEKREAQKEQLQKERRARQSQEQERRRAQRQAEREREEEQRREVEARIQQAIDTGVSQRLRDFGSY